jgi:hypothetical protein
MKILIFIIVLNSCTPNSEWENGSQKQHSFQDQKRRELDSQFKEENPQIIYPEKKNKSLNPGQKHHPVSEGE